MPVKFDMLAGEGDYKDLDNQLNFDVAVYAQLNIAAKKQSWYKLPCTGKKTEKLSKIRQRPDELFQDFVSQFDDNCRETFKRFRD